MGQTPLRLALALLILFGGGAGWLVWQANAPARALAAARARWERAPVEHYQIGVRMLGWGGCAQEAEVRRERLVTIARNTCRFFNPRTVSSLFNEAERFLRLPEVGASCRRGIPGRDCACYMPYQVRAVYHPERGYPEVIEISLRDYAPNRAHLHYWRYLLQHGHEPRCGGPIEPPGRHLVVELFEPLP